MRRGHFRTALRKHRKTGRILLDDWLDRDAHLEMKAKSSLRDSAEKARVEFAIQDNGSDEVAKISET